MDGRRKTDDYHAAAAADDDVYGTDGWFPLPNPQTPPENNNNRHQLLNPSANSSSPENHIVYQNPSMENDSSNSFGIPLNPTSQGSHNVRYPNATPNYQNPNPQNYPVHHQTQYSANLQNPITAQNQLMDDLCYQSYPYERSMYTSLNPNPNTSWDYPSVNQPQNSFLSNRRSTLNQSAALPVSQHRTENGLDWFPQSPPVVPVPVPGSLQKSEIMGLQGFLDRLKIDDDRGRYLGTTNNGFRHSEQNFYGNRSPSTCPAYPNNRGYGIEYDHPSGSSSLPSINGSSVMSPRSRYSSFDNAARARHRHHHNCSNYSSIRELKGKIFSTAKNEHGCRFLLDKLNQRNPIDIEMILSEVEDDLHEMMSHQSANYLIQKLIGVLNEHQMSKLVLSLVAPQHKLFRTCDDIIGSRVMQKLLDSSEYPMRQPLTPEQKCLLVSSLKNITAALCKSTQGNHVIKKCLQKFPSEFTKVLVEEISSDCLNLATDKSGCYLLQDCLRLVQVDEQRERIVAEIVANALYLADHPSGNYVVQYVLGLKIPSVVTDVLVELAGNYFTLAQGKCSSNVIEKCLLNSREEQSTGIINEIIQHPDILELMNHPFGNYVIQTAWTVSQGRRIQQSLYTVVKMNAETLQSQVYGMKVLAKVRGSKNCFH